MFGWRNKGCAGVVLIDGQQVADTLCCVHCNRHWIVQRGSGITRGFCTNCMGPTCGHKKCDGCYPLEKKLEDYEKGKIKILN